MNNRRTPGTLGSMRKHVVFALAGLAFASTGKAEAQPFPASVEVPGDTPANYSNYVFDNTEISNINTTFHVWTDPGRSTNVFWALQFGFAGTDSGAYIGLQSNGFKNERTVVFSVWDTTEAQAGDPQSYCTTFTGEGEGRSCRMKYAWEEGRDYGFRVAMEPDGWVSLHFNDYSANKTFNVGRIKNGATKIKPSMGHWTEYFEWSNKNSNCYNQPYSAIRIEVPYEQIGDTFVTANVTDATSGTNSCKHTALSQYNRDFVVFTAGIGNSLRGPIVSFEGQLLERDQTSLKLIPQGKLFSTLTLSKDGLFTDSTLCIDHDGSNVHGRPCTADEQQRWEAEPMRNGGYWIRHTPTNSCLDHEDGMPGPNKAIVARPCVPLEAESQRWYLLPDNKLGVGDECITLQDDLSLKSEQCTPGLRSQYWYAFPAVPEGAGWTFDSLGKIRLADNTCLTDENWNAVARKCDTNANNQKWNYDPKLKTLRSDLGQGACVAVTPQRKVTLQTCNGSQSQQWLAPRKP